MGHQDTLTYAKVNKKEAGEKEKCSLKKVGKNPKLLTYMISIVNQWPWQIYKLYVVWLRCRKYWRGFLFDAAPSFLVNPLFFALIQEYPSLSKRWRDNERKRGWGIVSEVFWRFWCESLGKGGNENRSLAFVIYWFFINIVMSLSVFCLFIYFFLSMISILSVLMQIFLFNNFNFGSIVIMLVKLFLSYCANCRH